jgi:DNA-directed RNA polymerase specialized sigma24 family protein
VRSPENEDWYDVAEPIVRAIIRKKLRVTLREEDERRENQDALDLVQSVYLDLAKAMDTGGREIKDLGPYAAVVTYHACAQYLRSRYPEHTRLKNKLRYFLSHEPGFAVWETREGESCCGYAGWQRTPVVGVERVQALIANPGEIWAKLSPYEPRKAAVAKALDAMKASDWRNLLEAIFDQLEHPLELDQLLSIASVLFGVKDEVGGEIDDSGGWPDFDQRLHAKKLMQGLWHVLQDFEHRWLMAFLLNLPGATKEARGEIEAFETSGAASRRDIGQLLGLIRREYEDLGHETREWPADPGSPEDRMAAAWSFLPREDILIARALQCEKQQVINLRAVAVQKAAKRMRVLFAAENS